jgi:hypothetical protein
MKPEYQFAISDSRLTRTAGDRRAGRIAQTAHPEF